MTAVAVEKTKVVKQREKTRRRWRRTGTETTGVAVVYFIGILIVILVQLCVVCSGKELLETRSYHNNNNNYYYVAPSRWSPARKARWFSDKKQHQGFSFHAPDFSKTKNDHDNHDDILIGTTTTTSSSSSSSSDLRVDDNSTNYLYEDDKRLVHTGPNPLHN